MPDGLVEKYVVNKIKLHNDMVQNYNAAGTTVLVGSGLIILAFLVEVRQGKIDHSEIKFKSGNVYHDVDKNGNLSGKDDDFLLIYNGFLFKLI